MIIEDRTFSYVQLSIMDEYDLNEKQMRILTDFAIAWDEEDRPPSLWWNTAQLKYMTEAHGVYRTCLEYIRLMREAGLMATMNESRAYICGLSELGRKTCARILDTKSRKMYVRVTACQYKINGVERYYTNAVWTRSLKVFADFVYVINAKDGGSQDQRHVYVRTDKVEQFVKSLRVYRPKEKPSVYSILKAHKAPQMLIDKVQLFGEGNLPNWLRYDVEQFIGEKLAI